jgi:hypothetical protein
MKTVTEIGRCFAVEMNMDKSKANETKSKYPNSRPNE